MTIQEKTAQIQQITALLASLEIEKQKLNEELVLIMNETDGRKRKRRKMKTR